MTRKRVSNAKKDTTYLYAAVELVAVYRLANINCKAFESLLHKFLACARIDLAMADRFGGRVQPREWFLVPLPVVEEVVERIKDGSISNDVFDVETASLKQRGRLNEGRTHPEGMTEITFLAPMSGPMSGCNRRIRLEPVVAIRLPSANFLNRSAVNRNELGNG